MEGGRGREKEMHVFQREHEHSNSEGHNKLQKLKHTYKYTIHPQSVSQYAIPIWLAQKEHSRNRSGKGREREPGGKG